MDLVIKESKTLEVGVHYKGKNAQLTIVSGMATGDRPEARGEPDDAEILYVREGEGSCPIRLWVGPEIDANRFVDASASVSVSRAWILGSGTEIEWGVKGVSATYDDEEKKVMVSAQLTLSAKPHRLDISPNHLPPHTHQVKYKCPGGFGVSSVSFEVRILTWPKDLPPRRGRP